MPGPFRYDSRLHDYEDHEPRCDVHYRVNGITAAHVAAIRTALKGNSGLKVELRDGVLYVSREGVNRAEQAQAFRREVDAAIELVAPRAEVTNIYPDQAPPIRRG